VTAHRILSRKEQKRRERRHQKAESFKERRRLATKLLQRSDEIKDELRKGVEADRVAELEAELARLRPIIMQLGYSPKTFEPPETGPYERVQFVQGGAAGSGGKRR
jgi:hypothetical protein